MFCAVYVCPSLEGRRELQDLSLSHFGNGCDVSLHSLLHLCWHLPYKPNKLKAGQPPDEGGKLPKHKQHKVIQSKNISPHSQPETGIPGRRPLGTGSAAGGSGRRGIPRRRDLGVGRGRDPVPQKHQIIDFLYICLCQLMPFQHVSACCLVYPNTEIHFRTTRNIILA